MAYDIIKIQRERVYVIFCFSLRPFVSFDETKAFNARETLIQSHLLWSIVEESEVLWEYIISLRQLSLLKFISHRIKNYREILLGK